MASWVRRHRRGILVGAVVLSIPYLLGLVDFAYVACGEFPIFSKQTGFSFDGGSTFHAGLGYEAHRTHRLDGTRGGAVKFCFPPVTLNHEYVDPKAHSKFLESIRLSTEPSGATAR